MQASGGAGLNKHVTRELRPALAGSTDDKKRSPVVRGLSQGEFDL
jgi:hypothetical protein